MTVPIHPKTSTIYAESPYIRKVKRIIGDLTMLESVAPIESKADILAIQLELEELLKVEERKN